MERSRKAKPLDAIDAIKTDDVIADTFASEAFLVLLADHRIDLVDLQILLRRVLDLLVRGCQSVHNLRIRELKKDAVGKVAQPLVLLATEDKNFVLQKSWKSAAVKRHSEVFGFRPELLDDIVVESGHAIEQSAQPAVVKHFFLVLDGQLLAEG